MLVGHVVVVCRSVCVCASGVDGVVRSPPTHRSAQNCQTVGLGTKPAILPADEVLDEAVESGSTQTAVVSVGGFALARIRASIGNHVLALTKEITMQSSRKRQVPGHVLSGVL